MFNCINCNKNFKYESDCNKHKNRKTPCVSIKKELKCSLCNVRFKWPAEQKKHEKNKKTYR
jgi:hypothetical protein